MAAFFCVMKTSEIMDSTNSEKTESFLKKWLPVLAFVAIVIYYYL